MGREKVRYLFNKNHVVISKIENPQTPMWGVPIIHYASDGSYGYRHTWDNYEAKERIVKKKSPLGFYYKCKERVPRKGSLTKNCGSDKVIITFPAPGEKNTFYEMKYFKRCGENCIGGEDGLRPWDVYTGDSDFPDHMLEALVKEANNFFDVLEASKSDGFYEQVSWYSKSDKPRHSVKEAKRLIFKDLFGNEKGPRFQTNDEKILAHGFDLKTSFSLAAER